MEEVSARVFVGVFLLFLIFLATILIFPGFVPTIRSWFKGSQKNYYFSFLDDLRNISFHSRKIYSSDEPHAQLFLARIVGSSIEICSSIFGWKGFVYGDKRPYLWRITRVWEGDDDYCVDLALNVPNQSVEGALRLINTYPSIQSMLDRIADLEHKLMSSSELARSLDRELAAARVKLDTSTTRRQEWVAAILAILKIIDADKQRYRSRAAEHIRKCLEIVNLSFYDKGEPSPAEGMVETWRESLSIL